MSTTDFYVSYKVATSEPTEYYSIFKKVFEAGCMGI